MQIQKFLPVLLAACLTTAAWAQTAGKPLNLKVPPGDASAPASSASTAGSTVSPASASPANAASSARAPGTYYGDTSGRMGNTEVASDARQACDDSTYNQAQVHGALGMGVMSGNRVSGSYQTGEVSVSKAFGSCDDPHGGVSFSISGGTGNFQGRGH